MVDKITDIEQWKINYPFLKELWASYENFDKTVQGDEKYSKYDTVCGMILKELTNSNVEHHNFCMKLLRNLNVFPENEYALNFNPVRCNNLNYWIYNSIKKHNIKDNLINKCFDNYFVLTRRTTGIVECNYHKYDESYDDPMAAIMLNIFDSNINDIYRTLKNTAQSIYMPGLSFVCECFKIYKDRYNTRCLNKYSYDEKQEKTCDKLGTFRDIYRGYLLKEESLVEKIPSFVNIEDEFKTKCKLPEQIPLVVPHGVQDTNDMSSIPYDGQRRNGRSTLIAGAGENEDRKLSLGPNGEETTGNPISSSISTAVGTMAGASSVLALLYKFTPGRKWIHSGFGGRRARIGSNFYEEGASELLHNGLENEDFSSYNQRYDIGYSPI